MNPIVSHWKTGSYGDRVSLSLDGGYTWSLSLTPTGVRLFQSSTNDSLFTSVAPNHKIKAFKGYTDLFLQPMVVSSVEYHGGEIACRYDGSHLVLTSEPCKGYGINWLLLLTKDGLYRYRFIDAGLLDQLDWPYDDQRALRILR